MSNKKCTHSGCTKWAAIGSIFCKDHAVDSKSNTTTTTTPSKKPTPKVNIIQPATVDGSLASFMGSTLGVQHKGKSRGLVKSAPIQNQDDIEYHQNKDANQAMARAFANMVMATKNQDGSVKLPSKIIAEREEQKKKERISSPTSPPSETKSPSETKTTPKVVTKFNPDRAVSPEPSKPAKPLVISTKKPAIQIPSSDSPPPSPPASPPPSEPSPTSSVSSTMSPPPVYSPIAKKPETKNFGTSFASSSSSVSSTVSVSSPTAKATKTTLKKSESIPEDTGKPLPVESNDSDSEDSLTAIDHEEPQSPTSPTSPTDDTAYIKYENLKKGAQLPDGVEADQRENYLSPDDFMKLFGMSKPEFGKLPKWKQLKLKEKVELN